MDTSGMQRISAKNFDRASASISTNTTQEPHVCSITRVKVSFTRFPPLPSLTEADISYGRTSAPEQLQPSGMDFAKGQIMAERDILRMNMLPYNCMQLIQEVQVKQWMSHGGSKRASP